MNATCPLALAAAALVVLAGASAVPQRAEAAGTAVAAAASTPKRILFDNSKAETAGNADWIISTSQPDPLGQNADPTNEASWTGAASAWGVALQKTGRYSLKTLPSGSTITYGTGGALDLANFDEFVLPEPNVRLGDAEKTAVMRFVQNGGGLFLISDHTVSDRNNDGWDSPAIINDLMTANSVDSTDPFGFSVDLLNIANENPRAVADTTDPVLNGAFGRVTGSIIRNGTTFTLKPADNPAVKGLVYRSGYSGNTGAFFVTSTFGSGRVAIWGDSSPIDDGTGQSGNTLYDGWNDPAGTDAALALNATAWLARGSGSSTGTVTLADPGARTATVGTATSLQLSAADTAGGTLGYTATGLPAGLSINSATGLISGTPTGTGTVTVTATATDSTGPSSSVTFTWTVNSPGGSGCTAAQLIANPGFEAGSTSSWTETNSGGASTINSSSSEPPHSGSYDAWLDGYGTTTTDTLAQTVTLPTGCTSYTFGFWLHIDSASSTTTAYDKLTVTADGTTLATYSNLNAATGYQRRTFDLAAYAGQSVTLKFTGAEDYTKQTSFVLDDITLNVS
ncbi:putative Ig domain-containing protein [Kitasatospora sp. DSM 101779]|uniref:putative Ig domain-containing protein n=1 Tax=Kitasatospora sp. DSM 101779 TaxID=2853165 RepID=UPI0021D87E94|nr:putative Ig domain-containing protein [Kitasatospora sp. DSM 101779]MCU7826396.1 putative Ig domain-containing protein [Kitasatospora sp. DSM 101779]